MKTGYIVKSFKDDGGIYLNHLRHNELHLISKITSESFKNVIAIKKVKFSNEDEFILMRF